MSPNNRIGSYQKVCGLCVWEQRDALSLDLMTKSDCVCQFWPKRSASKGHGLACRLVFFPLIWSLSHFTLAQISTEIREEYRQFLAPCRSYKWLCPCKNGSISGSQLARRTLSYWLNPMGPLSPKPLPQSLILSCHTSGIDPASATRPVSVFMWIALFRPDFGTVSLPEC